MATTQGVAVVWGVPSARQYGTGFTTTGAKYSSEGKEKEIQDASGETVTHVIHDKRNTLVLDVYPSGATPGTLPVYGSIATVNSVLYRVLAAEETSSNESEQKMSFTLRKWDNITLS
jgi:hypothetical protein